MFGRVKCYRCDSWQAFEDERGVIRCESCGGQYIMEPPPPYVLRIKFVISWLLVFAALVWLCYEKLPR